MAERSLNRVDLIGRLGKDSETAYTANQKAVTKFSIATEYRYKSGNEWKSQTTWVNIVAWQIENLSQYLVKGTRVFVTGHLQTRNYENKQGQKVYVTEVVSEDIILLGQAKASEEHMRDQMDEQLTSQPRGNRQPAPAATQRAQADDGFVPDDDVPF